MAGSKEFDCARERRLCRRHLPLRPRDAQSVPWTNGRFRPSKPL